MKNKVCLVFFVALLFISFNGYKKVNASSIYNVEISGDIEESENILILRGFGSEITNNYRGFLVLGYFTIFYELNNEIEEESCEWIIYNRDLNCVEDYGYDSSPWDSYENYAVYKVYATDETNPYMFVDGFGFLQRITENGTNYYYDNDFSSFIANNPRRYNGTDSIYGNDSVVQSVNICNDYYYANLRTHLGINVSGSCGYIAIALLLTYYDFFVNDSFITDNTVYNNISFIDTVSQNHFCTSNFTTSPGHTDGFHNFLIQEIGINDLGYHNNSSEYATDATQQISIINDYLSYYTNFAMSDYSAYLLASEEAIKSEINNNRPVKLKITAYEKMPNNESANRELVVDAPHSVICYGYKILSNGETIYRCHLGWRLASDNTMCDVLVKYKDVINGVGFTFSGNSNNCNDNVYRYSHKIVCNGFPICHKYVSYDHYLDKDYNAGYDTYSCPTCGDVLFQAVHEHNNTYSWRNYVYHYAGCWCGNGDYELHVVNGNQLPNGYYQCIYCGGYATMGINPNRFKLLNDNMVILPNK